MTAQILLGIPSVSPARLDFAELVAKHLPDGTFLAVSTFSEGAFTLTYRSLTEVDGIAAQPSVVCGDDFARDIAANGHEYVANRLLARATRAIADARTR